MVSFRSAATYATSFDEKLLGVGCDVEVVVDIESGVAQACVDMRSFLRSTPAFRITLEDLQSVSAAIRNARTNAKLLESLVGDALAHQLNYSVGGATLIVVHPKGKNARFTLSIGSFAREGDLDALTDKEIADAVTKGESLKAKVVAKVGAGKK
jgi:hypothetical protein